MAPTSYQKIIFGSLKHCSKLSVCFLLFLSFSDLLQARLHSKIKTNSTSKSAILSAYEHPVQLFLAEFSALLEKRSETVDLTALVRKRGKSIFLPESLLNRIQKVTYANQSLKIVFKQPSSEEKPIFLKYCYREDGKKSEVTWKLIPQKGSESSIIFNQAVLNIETLEVVSKPLRTIYHLSINGTKKTKNLSLTRDFDSKILESFVKFFDSLMAEFAPAKLVIDSSGIIVKDTQIINFPNSGQFAGHDVKNEVCQ